MNLAKLCLTITLLHLASLTAALPVETVQAVQSSPEAQLMARQNAATTKNMQVGSFEKALAGKAPWQHDCGGAGCHAGEAAVHELEGFIKREAPGLKANALKAFNQAMGTLFNKNLRPLIDKVQSAAQADIGQIGATVSKDIDKVNDDVQTTVEHVTTSVKQVIRDAAEQAKELVDEVAYDVDKVATDILQKATAAVITIESKFFEDAQKILTQINAIVQKGQCMEEGGAKQLQNEIYKLLSSWTHFYSLSSCWRSLGFGIMQSLESLTEMQLYKYHKQCVLLSSFKPTTSPSDRAATYAQGQLYAAEYFCIGETANSPAFQNWFTKEWVWWGVQYNKWKNGKPTSAPATNLGYTYEQDKDGTLTGSYKTVSGVTLDECKTRCGDSTWQHCAGFSRYASSADNEAAKCWWVADANQLSSKSSYLQHTQKIYKLVKLTPVPAIPDPTPAPWSATPFSPADGFCAQCPGGCWGGGMCFQYGAVDEWGRDSGPPDVAACVRVGGTPCPAGGAGGFPIPPTYPGSGPGSCNNGCDPSTGCLNCAATCRSIHRFSTNGQMSCTCNIC